jgi:hypothetical protein
MQVSIMRTVLTHATCILTGFAMAAWSLPQVNGAKQPRAVSGADKPGFWVSLPVAEVSLLDELIPFRGKNIRLVRGASDQSCIVDHAPLRLDIMERSLVLAGPLSALESFYLNILPQDLQNIHTTEFGSPTTLPSCRSTPKITYGE